MTEWLCFTFHNDVLNERVLHFPSFPGIFGWGNPCFTQSRIIIPPGHCYHNKAVRKTQKAWSWNRRFQMSLYCLHADLVGLMMFVWEHPKHYPSSTLFIFVYVYASETLKHLCLWKGCFVPEDAIKLWICSGPCSLDSDSNVSHKRKKTLHRCDVTVLPGLQHPPLQNMWQVGSRQRERMEILRSVRDRTISAPIYLGYRKTYDVIMNGHPDLGAKFLVEVFLVVS